MRDEKSRYNYHIYELIELTVLSNVDIQLENMFCRMHRTSPFQTQTQNISIWFCNNNSNIRGSTHMCIYSQVKLYVFACNVVEIAHPHTITYFILTIYILLLQINRSHTSLLSDLTSFTAMCLSYVRICVCLMRFTANCN